MRQGWICLIDPSTVSGCRGGRGNSAPGLFQDGKNNDVGGRNCFRGEGCPEFGNRTFYDVHETEGNQNNNNNKSQQENIYDQYSERRNG